MQLRYAEDPSTQLLRDGRPVGPDYVQDPVIGQIAKAVFGGFPLGFYLVAATTGLILVLAANTAFNGFPVLGSILARDDCCPGSCTPAATGSRTATASSSSRSPRPCLIVAFDAEVTKLIQLYIVGVFISFTPARPAWCGTGRGCCAPRPTRGVRRRMQRSRVINAIGLTITGAVLVVVL